MPDASGRGRRRRGLHLAVGGGLLLVYLALAALGPWVAPYGANDTDVANALQRPSGDHWFGTDNLGRDVFSRVLLAARVSMEVADVSVSIAGSGDARVYARGTLAISIAGSGDVEYTGDAVARTSVAGSGTVTKR